MRRDFYHKVVNATKLAAAGFFAYKFTQTGMFSHLINLIYSQNTTVGSRLVQRITESISEGIVTV